MIAIKTKHKIKSKLNRMFFIKQLQTIKKKTLTGVFLLLKTIKAHTLKIINLNKSQKFLKNFV